MGCGACGNDLVVQTISDPNGREGYDVGSGQSQRKTCGQEIKRSCEGGLEKCSEDCVEVEQETEMLNLLRTITASAGPRPATLLPSQRSRAGE